VRPTLADCLHRIDGADGTRAQDCLTLVDAADGIDASEASAIARVYIAGMKEVAQAGPPIRRGDQWLCVAQWGYKLTPDPEPIRIDARTGAVSLAGHRPAGLAELRTWNRPRGRRAGP
jgi:hypothetical protein